MIRRLRLLTAVRGLIVATVVTCMPGLAIEPTLAASDPAAVRAVLHGREIELSDVARYHCHDRAYPLIVCFNSPGDRDADELSVEPMATTGADGTVAVAAVDPYVRWYANSGHSGSSFVAYVAYSNLGSIGWNDAISSFITYSGGHPRWSQDSGYGPPRWDWGSQSVSYVGDSANDKFSSVERL